MQPEGDAVWISNIGLSDPLAMEKHLRFCPNSGLVHLPIQLR